MSLQVVPYTQAMFGSDFSQASVYIDACFLLAYYDAENVKGDRVAKLIDLWSLQNISKVGISNHTFIEVVNNLFKIRILTAMALQYKVNRGIPIEESEHQFMVGNRDLANRLIEIAGESRLKSYVEGHEVRFYVPGLIKEIKAERYHRAALDFHYNGALDEFRMLLDIFSMNNIPLEVLSSEAKDQHQANAMMRVMQLDAPDAIQLAVATNKNYDFFITMDRDFANSLYSGPSLSALTIIDLAA